MKENREKSVYAIVTERIIKMIEESIATGASLPWEKPWIYAASAPRNFITKRPYRGINIMLLEEGAYVTWTQICDLKKKNPAISLKKGCQREIVVYFNFADVGDKKEPSDSDQQIKRRAFLRYYNVYHIKWVNGLDVPPPKVSFQNKPIEKAQKVLDTYLKEEGICLEHQEGDKACYYPAWDRITLPSISEFKTAEAYYSTAFHEAIHSTGAKGRLNRQLSSVLKLHDYSKEELIAEMGSAMLMGACGIRTLSTELNSAAYMRSWIKTLENNITMVVSAASKAQAAADFIISNL